MFDKCNLSLDSNILRSLGSTGHRFFKQKAIKMNCVKPSIRNLLGMPQLAKSRIYVHKKVEFDQESASDLTYTEGKFSTTERTLNYVQCGKMSEPKSINTKNNKAKNWQTANFFEDN